MCGRYAITATAERIEQAFDAVWELGSLDAGRGTAEPPLMPAASPTPSRALTLPRFNVAPTQWCPVVRAVDGSHASGHGGGEGITRDGAVADAPRVVSLMRWGLVPAWADDPAIGNRLINARVETAASKPSFRSAWKRRRCIVPISHFFEWRRDGSRKQPMAICAAGDGEILGLAGLWESWRNEIRSFTILTTEPNDLLRPIHDRMPLILPTERWSPWLDPEWEGPSGAEEIAEWSTPAPEKSLRAYAVGSLVNSPRNDVPACVAPILS